MAEQQRNAQGQFEQPKAATKVVSFTITNGTFTLKVQRPGVTNYDRDSDPMADDVPADYLSAVTKWITETLR